MQETRQHILQILREQGQATVDVIVDALQTYHGKGITAVTVRHHLNVLQQEGLITEPRLRHRSTPGRPQHIYTLTEKARELAPNNYQQLLHHLLHEIERQLPVQSVNVIFEGIADTMAVQARLPNVSFEERMDLAVSYLNQHGYNASWEKSVDGIILHTRNCPYHHLSKTTDVLCAMDMRLMAALTGRIPRRISTISQGESSCAYLIPYEAEQ